MIYRLGNREVKFLGEHHFIAENATLIGSVTLANNVSIWFGAVIRGDDEIIIGEGTNIQDGAVLHTDPGKGMRIGKGVTVGHRAVLHGSEIGDNTLIGINAVVLDGALIGKNCVIGANSLITEGSVIPDNSLVIGSPGKVVKELKALHESMLKRVADTYIQNITTYINSLELQNEKHE